MFMLALIFYFIIGAGVCLLICVNPNDPGLLGRASNLLFKKLPIIVKYILLYVVALLVGFLDKED